MRNWFKRWRLVEDELDVVGVPDHRGAASDAASVLLEADQRPERDRDQHPGVVSLEGDSWTVHAAGGMVYLSGEDGEVQAQFSPTETIRLAGIMHSAAEAAISQNSPHGFPLAT